MSQTFFYVYDSLMSTEFRYMTKKLGSPTQILKKYHGQSKLGLRPQQREISEEIPRTKQVGVGAPTEIFEEIPRTKQVGVG